MNFARRVLLAVTLSYAVTGAVAQKGITVGEGQFQAPPPAGTWQRTTNHPPIGVGLSLLLTDGTVIMQNGNTRQWLKLTPDASGSYANGTWSAIASLPVGYAPLYYGSAVLADGRVVVIGGEYNGSNHAVWTNLAAIYDPMANIWSALPAPPGWPNIGDCQCCVLPDKRFLVANPLDRRMAVLEPTTLAWTQLLGTGKTDRFDEEGWTLLPDGTILTCDAINSPNTEKYIPSLDRWIFTGRTPLSLEDVSSQELGPMVLRPDGTVFATGATGHNAVYTPGLLPGDAGSWAAAPDFPNIGGQLDIADGPACLLPNGNVLCDASPGVFHSPSHFFEFDGTNLTQVGSVPNSATSPSFTGNMLMLPTGQVLFTDFSTDVEIYTPTGGPKDAWRPTITNCPTALVANQTFVIQGTQFNGLSQCSAYGDDSTNATNYPIVRITNKTTGHVFYCRTSNHSTMAVATGSLLTSTNVHIPQNIEVGRSSLQVVANGIASAAVDVNLYSNAPVTVLPASFTVNFGIFYSGVVSDLFLNDANRVIVFFDPTLSRLIPPVQVEFDSTVPSGPVAELDFQYVGLENFIGASAVPQVIEMFNFVTSSWVTVDNRSGTQSDSAVTVVNVANPADFIDPATQAVKARVSYFPQDGQPIKNVGAQINQAIWVFTH